MSSKVVTSTEGFSLRCKNGPLEHENFLLHQDALSEPGALAPCRLLIDYETSDDGCSLPFLRKIRENGWTGAIVLYMHHANRFAVQKQSEHSSDF